MNHYTANPHKLAAELSPSKVCEYLVSQGHLSLGIASYPNQPLSEVVLYKRIGDPPEDAIEVPLNPALADYGRRMVEALEAIGGPFLGLLHAIDPDRFPRERILALVRVTA